MQANASTLCFWVGRVPLQANEGMLFFLGAGSFATKCGYVFLFGGAASSASKCLTLATTSNVIGITPPSLRKWKYGNIVVIVILLHVGEKMLFQIQAISKFARKSRCLDLVHGIIIFVVQWLDGGKHGIVESVHGFIVTSYHASMVL